MSCAMRTDYDRHPGWRPSHGHGPPRGAMRLGGVVLMVLGFIVWWPIGLAILALTLWRKNMMCWNRHGEHAGEEGWGGRHWQRKMRRMEEKMERFCGGGHRSRMSESSGNRAFDEYRQETLKRLEDEQQEFQDFLERLRAAKDKQEFDLFMTERRNRPTPPPAPEAAPEARG